jgi:hypothetical protein
VPVSVTNLIRLPQRVSAQEIRSGIERALVRSAKIDAGNINVETDRGHVTLTGTVKVLDRARRSGGGSVEGRRDLGHQRHPRHAPLKLVSCAKRTQGDAAADRGTPAVATDSRRKPEWKGESG